MAQKVTVELVDDLDGTASSHVSTVDFGLDGVIPMSPYTRPEDGLKFPPGVVGFCHQ